MAFGRKILLGIDTLKSWCEQTFALKSHGTHVTTSTCVTSVNGQKGNVTISNSLPDISISDVNGLIEELNGKAPSSHGTHVSAATCVTSINGQTGAITIDSSGNYAPDDHHHDINDIDELQITLNGKAPLSHGTHVTTTTCVTSINGKKGDVTIATGSSGIGFPDYANMEDITSAYNAARSKGYTIENDGWIYACPYGNSGGIYINGVEVIGQSSTLTNKQLVPVKKKDVLSHGQATHVRFFPMR